MCGQCACRSVFENAIDMAHIHYLHNDTFGNQVRPALEMFERELHHAVILATSFIEVFALLELAEHAWNGCAGAAADPAHDLRYRALRSDCQVWPAQQACKCHVGVLQGDAHWLEGLPIHITQSSAYHAVDAGPIRKPCPHRVGITGTSCLVFNDPRSCLQAANQASYHPIRSCEGKG